MGNHEYNAICFHTIDPNNTDSYLRIRSYKNVKQLIAFLDDYLNSEEELKDTINWFKTLPLLLH